MFNRITGLHIISIMHTISYPHAVLYSTLRKAIDTIPGSHCSGTCGGLGMVAIGEN